MVCILFCWRLKARDNLSRILCGSIRPHSAIRNYSCIIIDSHDILLIPEGSNRKASSTNKYKQDAAGSWNYNKRLRDSLN